MHTVGHSFAALDLTTATRIASITGAHKKPKATPTAY